MRRGLFINFIVAVLSAGVGALSASAATIEDVRALYGDGLEFGVYRNGSPVGEHTVRFEQVDDGLRVLTSTELAVSALFITVYRFEYESEALWRDGALASITAVTKDGGQVSEIKAESIDGVLTVEGPSGTDDGPVGIYPTNHWNAGVIGSTRVLDTFTGRIADVTLASKGVEQVSTAHGTLAATRYQYSGAIDNEVWYDANGRWVKMQFKGTDGSTIQLRCRSCRAESDTAAR